MSLLGMAMGQQVCSTGSLTCDACPKCISATCSSAPVPLPRKSDFWPPQEILQRPWGPDPIPANLESELEWFQKTVLDVLPSSVKQSATVYALTDVEKTLVKISLSEWQTERAAGTYTCEQIATALIKRAKYLQDVQKMNHFMYWTSFETDDEDTTPTTQSLAVFDWIEVVMDQAKALDAKAASDGVEAIAPLYCYPVPLKGTMATVKFPSSAGFAVLQEKFALIDADLVTLVSQANGVLFGKTNVPELAHSWGTGNYANGLCFNPWDYDMMTGGSSGGSAAAVASYTAAIAVTEDTEGSTNTPAARNQLFGYDPPKFHYPNGGNPSLTVRNDQLGLNARSIDDIISFDQAVLDTSEAHAAAEAYVGGLSNADITIGCSNVYYNYTTATDAILAKYDEAMMVLKDAGFTFAENCQDLDPMVEVPDAEGESSNAVWYSELEAFLRDVLGEEELSPWDVLLNGLYDFGTTLSTDWMFNWQEGGCGLINLDSEEAREKYKGPIPAQRSEAYNTYFDEFGVDLLMGPSQYCDKVLWTEDIGGSVGANDGCDGGRSKAGCMYSCHSMGIIGSKDKTFTKAKFVVPIGLTEIGEPFTIQFMSRAGPREATVPAIEWVYDEEGPKTWNLEELYMTKRIADTLAAAGLERADAPINEEIFSLDVDPSADPSAAVRIEGSLFTFSLTVAMTLAVMVFVSM
jgi:Asp-tRNA(Asn)/Glu-tRNA(Gln) amidotransferase A subunit family amidase